MPRLGIGIGPERRRSVRGGGGSSPLMSIFGFEYPAAPPTEFPGNMIVGAERDATDPTKWVRQNSDAALSINPGLLVCNGSNGALRYIGFNDEEVTTAGDNIAVIAKIVAATGNISITSSIGSSTNSANTRLGWKQGLLTSASAVAPRLSFSFNPGAAGTISELRAYNVTKLMAQKLAVVGIVSQSQYVGSTRVADPDIETPVEGVVIIPPTTNSYVGAQALRPMICLDPCMHTTLNGTSGAYGGGPVGAFARELRKHLPADYTLVILCTGYNGAGFKTGSQWNVSAPGPAYTAFWNTHDAVMGSAPVGSVYLGTLFNNGETDLGTGNIVEHLSLVSGAPALFNEIRALHPDSVIVMSEMGMDAALSTVIEMNAAQQRLVTGSGDPLEFARCGWSGRPVGWALGPDNVHYDQATDRLRGPKDALKFTELLYPGFAA